MNSTYKLPYTHYIIYYIQHTIFVIVYVTIMTVELLLSAPWYNCVLVPAMRFAILEMKICLARIISEYNVTLGSKTQMPLQFEQRGFIMIPKGGILLEFEKRNMPSSTKELFKPD